MMKHNAIRLLLAAASAVLVLAAQARGGGPVTPSDLRSPQPPRSLRLYVIDCGTLHIADMGRFQLKKEEVSTTDLSVACFLVVHPKGTLIWDTGCRSRCFLEAHRQSHDAACCASRTRSNGT